MQALEKQFQVQSERTTTTATVPHPSLRHLPNGPTEFSLQLILSRYAASL